VARDWKYDRFLLVGVDESSAGASGCSIDAMVRTLGDLEQALQVQLLDHGPVLFRQDSGIVRLPRPAFAELARGGGVSADTVVFDNTVTRVVDLREGRWETPARTAWHARAFGLS
jgi:ribosomal protein L15E